MGGGTHEKLKTVVGQAQILVRTAKFLGGLREVIDGLHPRSNVGLRADHPHRLARGVEKEARLSVQPTNPAVWKHGAKI